MIKTTKMKVLLVALWVPVLVCPVSMQSQSTAMSVPSSIVLRSGTSTVSPIQDQANVFSVNHSLEFVWTGTAPATATISIAGAMRGATACPITGTTTSSSTTNFVLQPTGTCDKLLVTTSWTGGDSTTRLTINILGAPLARGNGNFGISGLTGTTQGQPLIGATTGAQSSQAWIDATAFSGADACAKIKAAIGNPTNSVFIDARGFKGINFCSAANGPVTFDALRSNVNNKDIGGTILFPCGGSFYVQGPDGTTPTNNFTDSFGSSIGTPAWILPPFVTFQGGCGDRANINATRVANSALGACDGTDIPVTGCTGQFPLRFATIAASPTGEAFVNQGNGHPGSSGSTTTCTPNGGTQGGTYCDMYIQISDGPFVLGGNELGEHTAGAKVVFISNGAGKSGSGEAVAIANCNSAGCTGTQANKINQTTLAENSDLFEVSVLCTGPNTGFPTNRGKAGNPGEETGCSNASQIAVRVAPGTVACVTTCGFLIFGTPIVGVSPPGVNTTGVSFTNEINFAGRDGPAEVMRQISIDAGNITGGVGFRNYFGQEHGKLTDVNITNISFAGYEDGTSNNQNWGPIDNAEYYGGNCAGQGCNAHNKTCGPWTTSIFHKSTGDMRGIQNLTLSINDANCQCTHNSASHCTNSGNVYAGAGKAAIRFEGNNTPITNIHCESFIDCLRLGYNEYISNPIISNINGQPSGANSGLQPIHIGPLGLALDIPMQAININSAANTIEDDFNLGLGTTTPAINGSPFTLSAVCAVNTTTCIFSGPGTAPAGDALYTGTIGQPGANNSLQGKTMAIAGFASDQNNGTYSVLFSNTTQVVMTNTNPVVVTAAGTATQAPAVFYISDGKVAQYSYDCDATGKNCTRICSSPNCPVLSNAGFSNLNFNGVCFQSASPAQCNNAPSGFVAVPSGASTTLVVNDTLVTATNRISLTNDGTVGGITGATCDVTATEMFTPFVSARTPGTSFTIKINGTTTATPCIGFIIGGP